MDSDNQSSNPNDPQEQRLQEKENKNGEHSQNGNLQDPVQYQTSDAQLNQGQGNQGQQSRENSQIEISQEDESDEDVFSDDASNAQPQHNKVVYGGQSDQTL